MPKQMTYVDAGVLISAFQGKGDISDGAMAVLDDPDREFVISDFLRLETLPKPVFHSRQDEVDFMEAFFSGASATIAASPALTTQAVKFACNYDLHPLDALHISAALTAKVGEFITSEKSTKPMFRISELRVISLRRQPSSLPRPD